MIQCSLIQVYCSLGIVWSLTNVCNDSKQTFATEDREWDAIRQYTVHLSVERTDGLAGEAGAMIELCHVAVAVQTNAELF